MIVKAIRRVPSGQGVDQLVLKLELQGITGEDEPGLIEIQLESPMDSKQADAGVMVCQIRVGGRVRTLAAASLTHEDRRAFFDALGQET